MYNRSFPISIPASSKKKPPLREEDSLIYFQKEHDINIMKTLLNCIRIYGFADIVFTALPRRACMTGAFLTLSPIINDLSPLYRTGRVAGEGLAP